MKNEVNNSGVNKSNINWFPGHMAKTKREISEKLNLVDIVYEVIDARMPISSKIVDIDDLIKNKPKILIVSKYDICDKKETDLLLNIYKERGYSVIPLDLIHGKCDQLINQTNIIMSEINKNRIQKGMKERAARVLIIGAPNVGKSTLINKLVGKKAAGVGNIPGFTKSLSWIRVNKNIELLDTPGILWPKFENQETALILASFSSIKEEVLNIDDLAYFIIRKMKELYPNQLMERYGLDCLDDDIESIYEMIGKKRGALKKGGIIDYDKVSKIIVLDFRGRFFGNVTFDRLDS